MIFESNTNFTNWLFDICMKRKALNKKLEGKHESDDSGSSNEQPTAEATKSNAGIANTTTTDTTANNNTATNETTTNNNDTTSDNNNAANNFEGLLIPL